MGHILMENRHGLIVDVEITHASGTAKREAALAMLARRDMPYKRITRSGQTRATTTKPSSRVADGSRSHRTWRPRTDTRRWMGA
jgi:hypothetical protein